MKRYEAAGIAILALLALALVPLSANAGRMYSAKLTGIGDSKATGEATFKLSDDGKTLHYKVTVSGIENPTMSHIHIAPEGKDGPPAVWLYPSGPPPQPKEGKFEGTLAEGDITAAGLKGPLEGKALSDLIAKIDAGEAYANVHTKQKPGGEVRGTIRHTH
ncbi:MAG TPA: CHRD domain-containing protein [Candidatus Deferrimicrobiaceae bacterium]